MKVLVIDIGGTHIKIASTDHLVPVKVVSGPSMTARQMVSNVLDATTGWEYDAISIGYPGPVEHDRPLSEPHNLASGWVGFPYQTALPKPIRFINDAAMQALGGYTGGKMLFLGIGTGLGAALIADDVIIPLELAHLPYKKGRTYEEYIGLAGLERRGRKEWQASVLDVIARFQAAFVADYIVLGGGNAKLMRTLPKFVRLGANSNAIAGGIALWERPAHAPLPASASERAAELVRKSETRLDGEKKESGHKAGKTKRAAKPAKPEESRGKKKKS